LYKDYTLYDEATGEIIGRRVSSKVPPEPCVEGTYSAEEFKVSGGKAVKRTSADVRARATEAGIRSLRMQRDSTLASSDWTQMPDSPLSEQERQQWASYRQHLRDLPANTPDPLNVTWPEPPTRGKRP